MTKRAPAASRRRWRGAVALIGERGWTPAAEGQRLSALLPPGWSMHSLRRRFATRAYSVDHDLLIVQQLLGHASLNTTRAYVRVDHEQMRTTVLAAA